MSWAALLRKSAEYARRALEEISTALRTPVPPASQAPTPSFEPAYARRRGQGRQFQSPYQNYGGQRQFSTCAHEKDAFFRSNYRGSHMHHRGRHHHRMRHIHCHNLRNRFNSSMKRGFSFPFQRNFHRSIRRRLVRSLDWISALTHHLWNPMGPVTAALHRQSPSIAYGLQNFSLDHSHTSLRSMAVLRVGQQSSPYDLMKDFFKSQSLKLQQSQLSPDMINWNRCKLSLLPTYQSVNAASSHFWGELPSRLGFQSQSFSADGESSGASCVELEASSSSKGFIEGPSAHDHVEHTLSAAVDFNLEPKLALPSVGELTDTAMASIREAISRQVENLQAVLTDISHISELGELPLSIERNGSTIRIHFPNSDTERVSTLIDDKEVTHGQVVEIASPVTVSGEFNEIDTISDFSSGVSTSNGSDSGIEEIWTHVSHNLPDLTMNDSSASNESPQTLETVA